MGNGSFAGIVIFPEYLCDDGVSSAPILFYKSGLFGFEDSCRTPVGFMAAGQKLRRYGWAHHFVFCVCGAGTGCGIWYSVLPEAEKEGGE
jgi:hypothetical protein